MPSENITVEQVLSRAESGDWNCSRCGDQCDCPNTENIIKALASDIRDAHKREIAEKEGERKGLLKANESLAADNTRLRDELKKKDAKIEQLEEKVVMRDCHCEDADSERMEAEDIANNLRALVKDLVDVAERFVSCKATECETVCGVDAKCIHKKTIELVAKAREMIGGAK